jgi:nucleoside-diphosphate-sugar epimerase
MVSNTYECYGICRNLARLPSFICGIKANVLDQRSVRSALLGQSFDYVLLSLTAGSYERDAYQAVYERALADMLEPLTACEPKRIFFVSSSRVYGENDGQWLDERSPAVPRDFAGESILKAESLLSTNLPIPVTVLRPGGIYGPEHKGLVSSVREGRARCPTRPVYSNRIHIEDLAGFTAHLLQGEPKGKPMVTPKALYIVSDSAPAPYSEVLAWLAKRLNAPAALAAEAVPARRRERYNRRLSNKLMLSSGYVLRYSDYRAGYGAILDTA